MLFVIFMLFLWPSTVMLAQEQLSKPDVITVWVHGTKPQPHLPECVTTFEKKFLKKQHLLGLHKVQELKSTLDYKVFQYFDADYPEPVPFDDFYFFGWSGILSSQERYYAARDLYHGLQKLVEEYVATHGFTPRLRLITHSHGGNVALNMTLWAQEPQFAIDELVLLACPVQQETRDFVHHTLFTKVYSLYSYADIVQRADPQGWSLVKKALKNFFDNGDLEEFAQTLDYFEDKAFFSDRCFAYADNLHQMRVKFNGRSILHTEFRLNHFIRRLPEILKIAQKLPIQCGEIVLEIDEHRIHAIVSCIIS